MSAPRPVHPLAAVAAPGPRGAAGSTPVRVTLPRRDIVQVMVRRGREEAFAAAMAEAFGTAPPPPGHAAMGREAVGGAVTAIWIHPRAYLLTSAEAGLAARAAARLEGLAAVEDQSHGRTTIAVAGAGARPLLARGCRIDLHPRAFGPGRATSTVIAQTNCLIHQTDDAPSFELTVFSTLAEPFFHWLLEAGTGIGLVVA